MNQYNGEENKEENDKKAEDDEEIEEDGNGDDLIIPGFDSTDVQNLPDEVNIIYIFNINI